MRIKIFLLIVVASIVSSACSETAKPLVIPPGVEAVDAGTPGSGELYVTLDGEPLAFTNVSCGTEVRTFGEQPQPGGVYTVVIPVQELPYDETIFGETGNIATIAFLRDGSLYEDEIDVDHTGSQSSGRAVSLNDSEDVANYSLRFSC